MTDWQESVIKAGQNEAKARHAEYEANMRTMAIFVCFVFYVIVSEWK